MNANGGHTPGRQHGEMRRAGVVALFLVAVAAILTLAILAFSHYSEALRAQAEDDLRAIAFSKAEQVGSFLRERAADAQIFSERSVISASTGERQPGTESGMESRRLAEAVERTRTTYGYRRVVIFGAEFVPVYPALEREADGAVANAIRASAAQGEPVIVDLHRVEDGTVVFGVAKAVEVHEGGTTREAGGIYLEMDAARHLYPMLATWPSASSRTGGIFLVRRQGDGVAVLSPLQDEPATAPLSLWRPGARSNELSLRALSERGGIVRGATDYRGRAVLGAAAHVAGTPWTLVAKLDEDEANEGVDELEKLIAGLSVLFLSLAGFVSALLWRGREQEVLAAHAALARRYFSAIEGSRDGYARIDQAGRLLETNRVLRGWLGYEKSDLRGLSVADLQAGSTPENVADTMRRISAEGAARFQARWRRRDGGLIDLDISAVHSPGDDGGHSFAYLRDISESLALTRRLQRLNLFYAFLTRINHALAGLREPADILRAVCEHAASESGFLLAWGGIIDADGRTVRVVAKAGEAAGYVEGIELSVDPDAPTGRGPTGVALREGRTEVANDFARDPRTAPWRERARAYGIAASAVTPVVVAGCTVGAITFYAGEPGYFDAEMLSLLEEAARSVALAWEAGIAERERDAARAARAEAEARYQTVFESSPLPKQIMSIRDRRVLAINRAHERLFGYRLEDIAETEDWFEKVFEVPQDRDRLRELWAGDLARAAAQARTVESPELVLRAHDGSRHVVRGYLSVVGDVAIVTWVDLTEARRKDQALRDSERRFRGMVEQALNGFYVVMGGKAVYVNPRLARMTGYATDELLGRDPLDFVVPEDRAQIIEGRERYAQGSGAITYRVRARRKDGQVIVLAITGAIGTWDGSPAIVSMVEDITEKASAEEQIRDYVGRLERSRHATLAALAKMVDLRDPYTAGHERRVGIIAAAIARELGWDRERARLVELVALVHDIGKIAVPAEILAKPTRLTASEFELVKGHAQAGYEILRDVSFEGMPVAEIVRQHHERMDGSGYPQGLKGEQILPEARVLAVADVLESMASHRPYRPALGLEAALGELQNNRGRLYGADCVDAALRVYRDKGERLPE